MWYRYSRWDGSQDVSPFTAEDVMDAMATEQLRRIPIVDERGSLVGIVSQADVVRKVREAGTSIPRVVPERPAMSPRVSTSSRPAPRWVIPIATSFNGDVSDVTYTQKCSMSRAAAKPGETRADPLAPSPPAWWRTDLARPYSLNRRGVRPRSFRLPSGDGRAALSPPCQDE